MSEKGQDIEVGQDRFRNGQQETRRRLLKTATLAPVIYTLSTGAATAAGSISCEGKPENVRDGVVKTDDQIRLSAGDEDPFCTLQGDELQGDDVNGGETCDGGLNGQWIYEETSSTNGGGSGNLTTASCWTSLM